MLVQGTQAEINLSRNDMLLQMKSPFAVPFQSSSLESAFTFAPAQPSTSSTGHKEASDSGPAAPQHPMEQDEVNFPFPTAPTFVTGTCG